MDAELDMVRVPAGGVHLRDTRSGATRHVQLEEFSVSRSAVVLPGADRPAPSITWFDAVRLCNRLSDDAGFATAYVIDGRDVQWDVAADGFRLPTEAEWEYACRAGTSGPQYADLRDVAWTSLDAVEGVQPPKLKRPNGFGLYDTLGNVWEWCWDYLDTARYGEYRVFRGGSWADPSWSVRASVRRGSAPDAVVEGTGIRVARGAAIGAVPGAAQGWSAARDRERADVKGVLPLGWTPLRHPNIGEPPIFEWCGCVFVSGVFGSNGSLSGVGVELMMLGDTVARMVEIRGELVRLRPWRASDASFVFDMYSKWDVQRFLGHQPEVMKDPARAEALVQRLMAVDDPIRGYWAVATVACDELVGTVMVQGIRHSGAKNPSDELEIGWHFHPDSWGHGYATSAGRLAVQHAFASGADRLVAVVHPENVASARVCQRLGMSDGGITDRYYDANYQVFFLDNDRERQTTPT